MSVPGFWIGMLIVLGLLFWFGYRAPMAGASLFTDPWVNLQLVIGVELLRRSIAVELEPDMIVPARALRAAG